MRTLHYYPTALDPSVDLDWTDGDDAVIDLSSATFLVQLLDRNGVVRLTKSSGIIGASTLPNARVVWSSGELSTLDSDANGLYRMLVTATVSGRPRVFSPENLPQLYVHAAVA